jgi:hypothetical protein
MTHTALAKKSPENDQILLKTKNQLVINALSLDDGVTLDEISSLAGWLPHSTRSFLTGLRKKGHVIESDKVDGVRRYRIIENGAA